MCKSKKAQTSDEEPSTEAGRTTRGECKSYSYENDLGAENQSELDKLFENYNGSCVCKEVYSGKPVGNELGEYDKTSAIGISREDY